MSAAQELMAEMNHHFGADTIRMASDPYFATKMLRTGILPIDVLLKGGVPRGRVTDIYGSYSSMKSYIGLKLAARTQKLGGVVAILDTEHTHDEMWAREQGCNTNDLIVIHPETGEKAIDYTEAMIRKKVDVVIWDSVAATLPKAEYELGLGGDKTPQPARLAALMSIGLRKLTSANQNHTAIVTINQLREKVGVTFGNPEVAPGGRALPFYASHRIAMRKGKLVKSKVKMHNGEKREEVNEYTAQWITATLEKSKLTSAHRDVQFVYDFVKRQIDAELFAVGYGLEEGLVMNEGTMWWLASDPGNKTKGRENFIQRMRDTPKEMEALTEVLLTPYRGSTPLPKSPGERPKRSKPKSVASDSTPTAERAGGRTTPATKSSTTSSSKPAARSRSAAKS